MIRFHDLSYQVNPFRSILHQIVDRVIDSNWFVMGKLTEEFEVKFSDFIQRRFVIACSSGTAALHLACMALEIGPKTNVVTVANTFAATAIAPRICGASVSFKDIDPKTLLLSDQATRQIISESSLDALIAVHLYGRPINKTLLEKVNKAGKILIEDCAHAIGPDLKLGDFANCSCYSFFPSKNLGGIGEGGAIACDDPGLAQVLRELRNIGQGMQHEHKRIGLNYRPWEINSGYLIHKLSHLSSWNDERRRIANYYSKCLESVSDVMLPPHDPLHVYHAYVIRSKRREHVIKALNLAGVETRIQYPIPIHRQISWKSNPVKLPETERASNEILSLPLYPGLPMYVPEMVAEIISKVHKAP